MIRSRPVTAGSGPRSDPDHDHPVLWLSVEVAAERLSITPVALRHRLRRAQRVVGRHIVADLDGIAEGRKLGSVWRVRVF